MPGTVEVGTFYQRPKGRKTVEAARQAGKQATSSSQFRCAAYARRARAGDSGSAGGDW